MLTSLSTVHVIASKPNTIAEDDTQEDGESHTLCHIRYFTYAISHNVKVIYKLYTFCNIIMMFCAQTNEKTLTLKEV